MNFNFNELLTKWNGLPLALSSLPRVFSQKFLQQLKTTLFGRAGVGSASEWDVMAHWLRRLLSTGGSWVRLPLWPSRRDLGQVLSLQLPVRFGVKLRYSIRAVVGSASEW